MGVTFQKIVPLLKQLRLGLVLYEKLKRNVIDVVFRSLSVTLDYESCGVVAVYGGCCDEPDRQCFFTAYFHLTVVFWC
jgi:hypothetical protein